MPIRRVKRRPLLVSLPRRQQLSMHLQTREAEAATWLLRSALIHLVLCRSAISRTSLTLSRMRRRHRHADQVKSAVAAPTAAHGRASAAVLANAAKTDAALSQRGPSSSVNPLRSRKGRTAVSAPACPSGLRATTLQLLLLVTTTKRMAVPEQAQRRIGELLSRKRALDRLKLIHGQSSLISPAQQHSLRTTHSLASHSLNNRTNQHSFAPLASPRHTHLELARSFRRVITKHSSRRPVWVRPSSRSLRAQVNQKRCRAAALVKAGQWR